MSSNHRNQRIASLVRAELARLILEEVADPCVNGLVVTNVEMAADFKQAKVFYTPSGAPTKPKEIERGLQRAQSFLKRKLADNLDLRYVPALEFHQDTHGDSVARLYSLFDSVELENKNREHQ